ncbi:hypothetical protein OHA71_48800 [Streptomyces sp. NBC_00444]|uniref:hypothetical protein n=1 Tax=Streptomyces sp. NBC_00444 TaxID=2975744 RepID=UPI002E24C759
MTGPGTVTADAARPGALSCPPAAAPATQGGSAGRRVRLDDGVAEAGGRWLR